MNNIIHNDGQKLMNIPKLTYTTLHNGCDSLHCEMEEIHNMLEFYGFRYTPDLAESEIVILFCCTFTGEREKHTLHLMQELKQLNKTVIVSGCFLPHMIEQFPNVVFIKTDSIVDYFLSNFNYLRANINKKSYHYSNCINIASGCLGRCTYCSIRLVRKSLKSIPIDRILDIINNLQDNRRIKLVAQDVSAYGLDINTSLPILLKSIWNKYPTTDIELGNLNIAHLKKFNKDDLDLLKRIKGNINIPIQSASDKVLKEMKREYCTKDFEVIYNYLYSLGCTISTDIMAGFPTESETDHQKNMKLLADYYFNFAQIFMFEPRQHTEAFNTVPQLAESIKMKRTIELIVQFLDKYCKTNHISFDFLKETQVFNTNIKIG